MCEAHRGPVHPLSPAVALGDDLEVSDLYRIPFVAAFKRDQPSPDLIAAINVGGVRFRPICQTRSRRSDFNATPVCADTMPIFGAPCRTRNSAIVV